jgi:hypothetical protein
MAAGNSRTTEQVRHELETERERLAEAVDVLRSEVKEATDVRSKLREHLPVAVAGAAGVGFFLAGGVGATMRLLARRGREGQEKARFGRFSASPSSTETEQRPSWTRSSIAGPGGLTQPVGRTRAS